MLRTSIFISFLLFFQLFATAQAIRTEEIPQTLFSKTTCLNIYNPNDVSGEEYISLVKELKEKLEKRKITITCSNNLSKIIINGAYDVNSPDYPAYIESKKNIGNEIMITKVAFGGGITYAISITPYDPNEPNKTQDYYTLSEPTTDALLKKFDKELSKQFDLSKVTALKTSETLSSDSSLTSPETEPAEILDYYPEDLSTSILIVQGMHTYEVANDAPEDPERKKAYNEILKLNKIAQSYNEERKKTFEQYPYEYLVVPTSELHKYNNKKGYYLLDAYSTTELASRTKFIDVYRNNNGHYSSTPGSNFTSHYTDIESSHYIEHYYYFYIRDLNENKVYVVLDKAEKGEKDAIKEFCESVKK